MISLSQNLSWMLKFVAICVILLCIDLSGGLSVDDIIDDNERSFSSLMDFHSALARSKSRVFGNRDVDQVLEESQNSERLKVNGLKEARMLYQLRKSRGSSGAAENIAESLKKKGKAWTKRQAASEAKVSSKMKARQQQWDEEDKFLQNLQFRGNCLEKVDACAKNAPLRYVECFLDCYLGQMVNGDTKIKFLYRFLSVFVTYSKLLCPVFGNIYKRIGDAVGDRRVDASVQGFLAGIGLEYGTANFALFMKNAADSLFYYVIIASENPEMADIKPVLISAQDALMLQGQSEAFKPEFLDGAVCNKLPKSTWYMTMIDFVGKRPLYTDMLLRGYFLITRLLSQSLPYPTETMFLTLAHALKLMIGVDCSAVTYAQTGEPYQCVNPAPIDDVHAYYEQEATAREQPFPWLVCGAHQVTIPEFVSAKENLKGRLGLSDVLSGLTNSSSPFDALFTNSRNPEEPGEDDYVLDKVYVNKK